MDSGFGLSSLLIKESSTDLPGVGADHHGSGSVWEDSATLLDDSLRWSQENRTGHGGKKWCAALWLDKAGRKEL